RTGHIGQFRRDHSGNVMGSRQFVLVSKQKQRLMFCASAKEADAPRKAAITPSFSTYPFGLKIFLEAVGAVAEAAAHDG
ncbi:hypothetical protein ACC763_41420, partial [Rhizobium ruizarguesonis]